MTETTITLGFEYAQGTDEVNRSFGFDNITTGDGRQQLEIMIREINKTGGIAGRRVVPVFHVLDAASQADSSTQERSACAAFTEDAEVFAVLSAGIRSEQFVSCLGARGVAFVNAPGLTTFDEVTYQRNPLFVSLNTAALNQQFNLYGQALAGTGYFSKDARVGVLTYDLPAFTRALRTNLVPALHSVGRAAAETVLVSYPQQPSDATSTAAAVSAAVLRFQQSGVTHVLLPDERGFLTALFTQAASSQRYFPRLALLAQNAGQSIADASGDKTVFTGAVELGWLPAVELSASQETLSPPGKRRCLELFRAAGYPAPQSRNEELILEMQCDVFFFAQEAGRHVERTLSAPNFIRAFAQASSQVAAASTYRIDLRAHRAGASAYRVLRWRSSCSCFAAEGGVRPMR